MSNRIWTLNDHNGRVVGASAFSPFAACEDALRNLDGPGWSVCEALRRSIIEDATVTRYEAAGYVLALVEVSAHA